MRAMRILSLAAAIALAVSSCATTTSPTGRTQYVGAVSQQQLDQLGAQAFAEIGQFLAVRRIGDDRARRFVRVVFGHASVSSKVVNRSKKSVRRVSIRRIFAARRVSADLRQP